MYGLYFDMSKQNLTVQGIESRLKKGRNKLYSDAGARGLYLKTTASGTGSWVFRYRDRATGKLRDMGLGRVKTSKVGEDGGVSLKEARELAGELSKEVRNSSDPIAARRHKRQERIAEHAKAQTFEQVSEAFYAAKVKPTGYTEKHKRRWKSMMKLHVYPKIGKVLVRDIELAHIEAVLAPIWADHLDMARKSRQSMEKVMSWAITGKLHPGPNPATWKGNLETRLADTRGIRKGKPVQHHPALPWQQINPFVIDLQKRGGIGARALEFAILTAARAGEVRLATWDEIDMNAKLWVVPKERMGKNEKLHKVPLSKSALRLLNAQTRLGDSPYIFPAVKGGPLSDMAMSQVCRRMHADSVNNGGEGYLDPELGRVVVPHGFRSTFKDWCRNATNYPDEVSELALAHVNSDATRAAYARDELIEPRTRLMRDWARHIGTKPVNSANVTPIGQATV